MTNLIITVGLPGARKTTRAERWVAEDPRNRARVNRDDLRDKMFGRYTGLDDDHEAEVTLAQHAEIRDRLRNGQDVVVDDTNLNPEHVEALRRIGEQFGADVEIWDMTNVPVKECIDNDRARGESGGRRVGADVIRRLHTEWLQPAAPTDGGPGRPQHQEPLTDAELAGWRQVQMGDVDRDTEAFYAYEEAARLGDDHTRYLLVTDTKTVQVGAGARVTCADGSSTTVAALADLADQMFATERRVHDSGPDLHHLGAGQSHTTCTYCLNPDFGQDNA